MKMGKSLTSQFKFNLSFLNIVYKNPKIQDCLTITKNMKKGNKNQDSKDDDD